MGARQSSESTARDPPLPKSGLDFKKSCRKDKYLFVNLFSKISKAAPNFLATPSRKSAHLGCPSRLGEGLGEGSSSFPNAKILRSTKPSIYTLRPARCRRIKSVPWGAMLGSQATVRAWEPAVGAQDKQLNAHWYIPRSARQHSAEPRNRRSLGLRDPRYSEVAHNRYGI